MKVVGVDLGIRKIAWSLWEEETLVCTSAKDSLQLSRGAQLEDVAAYLGAVVLENKPDYVVIEDTLIGNNKSYSIKLSQTMGAVLAYDAVVNYEHPHGTLLVNNKTWKKEVVGNGNAHKNTIKNHIAQINSVYPALCGYDQDRYDAACIGLYGVRLAERAAELATLR